MQFYKLTVKNKLFIEDFIHNNGFGKSPCRQMMKPEKRMMKDNGIGISPNINKIFILFHCVHYNNNFFRNRNGVVERKSPANYSGLCLT